MVFDFSGYLVGKWLDGSTSSGYGQILGATLRDERTQEYNILYCYKAYGADPCTPTSRLVKIGETTIRDGWGWASQFSWSYLGIPESKWTAYKRWLIEKECMLSNFAW